MKIKILITIAFLVCVVADLYMFKPEPIRIAVWAFMLIGIWLMDFKKGTHKND